MSGPKVDVAALRRQEQEKIERARKKRQDAADKIEKQISRIRKTLSKELADMLTDSAVSDKVKSISALQESSIEKLNKLIEQLKRGNENTDVDSIVAEAEAIIRKFDSETVSDVETIKRTMESDKEFRQMMEQRKTMAAAKRTKITRMTAPKKGSREETGEVKAEINVEEQAEAFEEEIKEFLQTPMTGRHKSMVIGITQDFHEIMKSDYSDEIKSKKIISLFHEYETVSSDITAEVAGMTSLYEEYKRECFDLESEPLSLSDFSSVKELKQALEDVKEAASRALSKEYIQRQIAEVMAKHNYNVVSSESLKEAEDRGEVLYGVNDDTAITVFVSDTNQVSMRVVGIGFDENISEKENEDLYQQQVAFCTMHPQITAELAARGVLLTAKVHQPPHRRFNKKVVAKTRGSEHSGRRAKLEARDKSPKTMYKE